MDSDKWYSLLENMQIKYPELHAKIGDFKHHILLHTISVADRIETHIRYLEYQIPVHVQKDISAAFKDALAD